MKTKIATAHDENKTSGEAEAEPGRKPILALAMQLLWTVVLVLPAFGAHAGVVLTTLYSFTGTNDGEYPGAALVQASDGSLYGTTRGGGTYGGGTVFRISTNGTLTTLYSFTSGDDGGIPVAALVQGTDGNLYGTADDFGQYGLGTIFQIGTDGTLTTLYSFPGGDDGGHPWGGLVQGADGNLYGTTIGVMFDSGVGGLGTVFQISTNGVLNTLYSFAGNDGAMPRAGLVQGSDGNFYGTTSAGGTDNQGTVFQINTNGALTTLYSFTGGDDGGSPWATLAQGSDGNFYGATSGGGTDNQGTVFQISTNGTLTMLYSFTGGKDGGEPDAGVVQGSDGKFYGTTSAGGADNQATIFEISANGALTTLYSFTGNDGAIPDRAGLVQEQRWQVLRHDTLRWARRSRHRFPADHCAGIATLGNCSFRNQCHLDMAHKSSRLQFTIHHKPCCVGDVGLCFSRTDRCQRAKYRDQSHHRHPTVLPFKPVIKENHFGTPSRSLPNCYCALSRRHSVDT